METPPQARGPGRSGPRRRTGCLTCRARKVRCDEAKPNCANCSRLRLQCVYKNVIISGIPHSRSSRARSTSSTTQEPEEASPGSAASDIRTVARPNEQARHQQVAPQQHAALPSASPDGPPSSDFSIPFDMLGFIGEITSDFQQKHLDLTNGGAIASSSTAIAEVDGNLFHDERQMTWGPGGVDNVGILPEQSSPRRSSAGEVYEEELLEHFRGSEAPPTIFGPVDLEWKHVRDAMLTQAGDCRSLLLAIYCYSDIHTAWVTGRLWKLGPTYHAQASSEIQTCLLGEVGESSLKKVYKSILLLMLAELISHENWRPATPFLHTSYLILQRFYSRTRTWTGLAHLIASWVTLLDIKALVAGRDGDPLAEFGNLTPPEANDISNPTSENDDTLDDPLLTCPTYLITHSITSPAFTFFLATQQLTRRIVIIDLHHRTRGTVSDEFEVLQIAHTVSADLETLWNRRPKILDLYSSTPADEESLYDSLAPILATVIIRTFRTYVANFLALFVYLHRVAFAIYPRTDRVYRAVDQIIHLAKEESSRPHRCSTATATATNTPGYGSVPMGFVWPLFIAALEGSIEQREWIVAEMQRMAALGPGLGHPNAGKALVLLEEMTRRQDVSRTWADSRCVRRELFADFFVMI